jgi:DNA-binding response OmpR family regulator
VQHRGLVVVLEEDPQIRPLLERWLDEAGYAVAARVPDGETRPVLVIADLRDPHAADALIRSLQEYRVAVLAMSARFRRGLAGSAEAARRLGVQGVLPKPFTRTELLAAVRDAIEGTA